MKSEVKAELLEKKIEKQNELIKVYKSFTSWILRHTIEITQSIRGTSYLGDIQRLESELQAIDSEWREESDREKIMAKYNINEDMVDDYMKQFPRRNNLSLCTPAELAIFKAMQEVEKVGADVKLTDAIVLLGKAKDCVSDFIDGVTAIDSDKENDIHYWKCPECNSIFATSKHTPEWMAQKTAIIHTNTLYDIPCRAEYVEITKEEFFRIDAKRDDTIKKKVCE